MTSQQITIRTFYNVTRNVFKPQRKRNAHCSNALPFNLVHFPKGEYPGKLTQREIISEEELSEQLDCLSE